MASLYKELDGKRVKMASEEVAEFRSVQKEAVNALAGSWTIDKAQLWQRLSGEEAGAVYSSFAGITPADAGKFRLRMIFESTTELTHLNEDHAKIRQIITDIIGEERTSEIFRRN